MKKYHFLLTALIALATTGIAQTKPGFYSLKGKLTGLKNEKVYLSSNNGDTKTLDSTFAREGAFSFVGKINGPMFYFLRIDGGKGGVGLFLEPNPMTIKGNKDSLAKAVVTGSVSNNQWKDWSKSWNAITVQAGPMYMRLDSANQHGKVKESPEERKIFDDGMKSLNEQTAVAVTAFIKKYPESAVAPFIIYDRYISFPNPEMAKSSFALLGNKAKNSFYGKQITHYQLVAAKTGIGAMPDFAVMDTSGKILKLSDLRGKYVLVDFWASWCIPCRKENPNVVKAYKAYHDKGFEIVGVSLDTKKDAWQNAIAKDGLTWNHVSDLKGWESGVVQEFGITVVPTSFLLDKSGKVIANNLREEALPKKLAQLLN